MGLTKHDASPKQRAAYEELSALVEKYSKDVPAIELLALAANIVGKLAALQDRQQLTPAEAMEIIAKNIEEGNAEMLAALEMGCAGNA